MTFVWPTPPGPAERAFLTPGGAPDWYQPPSAPPFGSLENISVTLLVPSGEREPKWGRKRGKRRKKKHAKCKSKGTKMRREVSGSGNEKQWVRTDLVSNIKLCYSNG